MDERGMSESVDENEEQYDRNEARQLERNNKGFMTKHDRCYSWMLRNRLGWLARLPGKWPRTFAIIFGVVRSHDLFLFRFYRRNTVYSHHAYLLQICPLFLLIGVSLFFGYGLAKLEAPSEIDGNNDIIANRARVAVATQFHNNVTERLPQICLNIYTQNLTVLDTLEAEFDEIVANILDKEAQTTLNSSAVSSDVDLSRSEELLDFMLECGKTGLETADAFNLGSVDQDYIGEDLTFNWVRCDGLGLNSSTLLQQVWGRPFVDRDRLKPDAQTAAAIFEWRRSRQELYNEYMKDLLLADGTRPVGARVLAFRQSLEYANGFSHCSPNSAAGAWFWFTIMTTIGYGNTAPTTEGGRAMIYTLGFFSILLFAGVLGTAGTIVVTIWDDFIDRTKLHQLNIPWVGCIFWGCCYYAWMLVIAAVTQNWKAARLGEDMDFSEAYWFSYVSTTTVGLGDYYLEHDVILRQDLFVFPVMFLAGFVLLANFFVKLSEVLTDLVPQNNRSLEETLADSDVPCLPKTARNAVKKTHQVTNQVIGNTHKVIGSIAHSTIVHSSIRPSSGKRAKKHRLETIDSEDAELATIKEAGNDDGVDENTSVEVADGWTGIVTGAATNDASLPECSPGSEATSPRQT